MEVGGKLSFNSFIYFGFTSVFGQFLLSYLHTQQMHKIQLL